MAITLSGVTLSGVTMQPPSTEPNPSLLLHFDGNTSSPPATIIDSSCNNATFTLTNADIALSTSMYKFGTASLNLTGGSRYIYTSDGCTNGGTLDLRNGDFTVEGWFYRSRADGATGILINFGGATSTPGTGFSISAYGTPGPGLVSIETSLYGSGVDGGLPVRTAPLNEWVHWALVRNGIAINIYINGVKDNGSVTCTGQWGSVSVPDALRIGGFWLSNVQQNAWSGYLDEFRIVKGTAVYTANFTPPNAPFANPSC